MAGYAMGDPELDRGIEELIRRTGDGDNPDLIAELMTTALKLYRDEPDRGELKLFNSALKEMRYSARVFRSYGNIPKVTIFGSARTPSDHPDYQLAKHFADHMWRRRGWMVVTGAGGGIMEAGNRGAGREGSFGVNIRLPFEANANPYVPDHRLINFKYFFTRKLGFVKESHAFAIFPGGFGTMDETFELLTLIQTGKAPVQPVVLMESGTSYWPGWQRFVEERLLANGMISAEDPDLYRITGSVEEAADEICRFYVNYHSQRYVEGRLILRLRHAPTRTQIEAINEEFIDIVTEGRIEIVPAAPAEIRDDDALDCTRVGLAFDRRRNGRLRSLINRLNGFAYSTPGFEGPLLRPLTR
ncbi:MAG: LOG family protein [bacterium]|nr:LOG family protein [bacterium]MDE0289989.1 LOG family protein [bacterium]MDE0437222.1 LOG family protein [bacterium]